MQIKSDFTKEQLMEEADILFEACHPIGKLKAIASLLYAYPNGLWDMDKSTMESVSDMIEDATKDIEYLIRLSNEQYNLKTEKEALNA